jgi:lysophospholipase L1-like esterase
MILRPSAHPILKYELTPGASGWAWEADVTINSHGFRGPDPAQGEYQGYRILILGDSITFGYLLSVEAIFVHQLQQRLRAKGQDFEVLNLGVVGYDTLQEVALLELRGLKLDPDLVIVAYCLNDVGIVSTELHFIETLEARQNNLMLKSKVVQFITEKVDMIKHRRWLSHKNNPTVFRRDHEQWIETIGDDDDELMTLMEGVSDEHPSAWYRSSDRIGRLRFAFSWLNELSREGDFAVLVTLIPWLTEDAVEYPHAAAHRIVEFEACRAGFDTIDLTERFKDVGFESLRKHPRDRMHPNEAGHTLIADELFAYIQAEVSHRQYAR